MTSFQFYLHLIPKPASQQPIPLSTAVLSISSLPPALLNEKNRICVRKQDVQTGGADPIWCWMFKEHWLQEIEAASLSAELFSPEMQAADFSSTTNTIFMSYR